MSKFTICPRFVSESNARDFADILFSFAQSNEYRVLVDFDMEIVDRYRTGGDRDGFCATWISLLLNGSLECIRKVRIKSDAKLLANENLAVEIASEAVIDRKIIIDDPDDYIPLGAQIAAHSIKLIGRSSVRGALSSAPVRFDYENLTVDLLRKACRMTERKATKSIEDIHNDTISDFLRDKGYSVADQSRSGRSGSGKSSGELDVAIRAADGNIESVIEAFRLSSCGKDNEVVAEHLDKLVHKYDTAGLARNFVLVYAEAEDFDALWGSYISYLGELNSKAKFKGPLKLSSIKDISSDYGCPANVRVALATHSRKPQSLEIVHIFVKMV